MAAMPLSSGFLERTEPKPSGSARYLGFAKGRLLISGEAAAWVNPDAAGLQVYLGTHGDQAIYAQDLTHLIDTDGNLPGVPTDLWLIPRPIPDETLALAAQGQHVLRWHAKHGHCAKCGGPTQVRDLGRKRWCSMCVVETYPRIDPAVIMLVRSPDLARVLLAHTHAMPPGLHSLLAGYVEPGETLEDTVRRETFEEAGVRVHSLKYAASQPWALSGSIMCGFTCIAADEALTIDTEELESAAWFSRKDLAAARAQPEFIYPRRNTIARQLLDWWAEG